MIIQTRIAVTRGMSGVATIAAIKEAIPNVVIPMCINKQIFHLMQYVFPKGLVVNDEVWLVFVVNVMFGETPKCVIDTQIGVFLNQRDGFGRTSKGRLIKAGYCDPLTTQSGIQRFALKCVAGNAPRWVTDLGQVKRISSKEFETIRFMNGVSVSIPHAMWETL